MTTELTELSLPELHQRVLTAHYATNTGSAAHDALNWLLTQYQAADDDMTTLTALALTCEHRLARTADHLPLDLINAYNRLARLARWRAAQPSITERHHADRS
jgi:hypothetical protein